METPKIPDPDEVMKQLEDETKRRIAKQKKYYEQVQVASVFTLATLESMVKMSAEQKDGEKERELSENLAYFVRVEHQFRDQIQCLKKVQDMMVLGDPACLGIDWAVYLKKEREALQADKTHQAQTETMVQMKLKEVRETLKMSAGDEKVEVGDEPAIVGSKQSLVCPITTMTLEVPYVNLRCHHHYSEAAILDYLNSRGRGRRDPKCPFPGCSGTVTRDMIERDVQMERLIAKETTAKRKREEDTPHKVEMDCTQASNQ